MHSTVCILVTSAKKAPGGDLEPTLYIGANPEGKRMQALPGLCPSRIHGKLLVLYGHSIYTYPIPLTLDLESMDP